MVIQKLTATTRAAKMPKDTRGRTGHKHVNMNETTVVIDVTKRAP